MVKTRLRSVQYRRDGLIAETGPTTLTGKVAFRLVEAGLDFSSRSLDWLVVTPDGRFAVKGGAVDASARQFGFVFYGTQGCGGSGPGCQPGSDRMRILIWNLTKGSTPEGVTPIYDNVPNASLEVDDFTGQALGGATCRSIRDDVGCRSSGADLLLQRAQRVTAVRGTGGRPRIYPLFPTACAATLVATPAA